MQVLYPRCSGLDIHKATIAACVLVAEGQTKQKHLLRCATMTRDLLALADWLSGFGVTHVALESTGVYWKPIWNILRGSLMSLWSTLSTSNQCWDGRLI